MYNLTEKEKLVVNKNLNIIIKEIKKLISFFKKEDLLDIFYICSILLHSGYFSINKSYKREINYPYIYIKDLNNACQVMCGYSVCRHANSFLYEILNEFNFNSQMLSCILNEFNKQNEDINHEIVLAAENGFCYGLDLYNNLLFYQSDALVIKEVKGNYSLELKDIYSSKIRAKEFFSENYKENKFNKKDLLIEEKIYQLLSCNKALIDDFYEIILPNIKNITEIIKKYEVLRSYGITYIYEDMEYVINK